MENKDFTFNYINHNLLREDSSTLESFYKKYKNFSMELKKVINNKEEQLEFFKELEHTSTQIGAKDLSDAVNAYYESLNSHRVQNELLIDISFEIKQVTNEIKLCLE